MAEYQKICVICGCEFIAGKPHTVYCSQRCKQTAYRTGRTVKKYSKNEKITDDQLSQAIDEGFTRQEIADKYGMHVESIARRMQRIGKYATGGDKFVGIRQNWGNKCENLNHGFIAGCCWHYIESQNKKINENHKGFIYLEGRSAPNPKIRIKCKTCGNVFDRSATVLQSKNITCDYCVEKQKQEKQLQDERINLMRFFVALINSKEQRICEYCGTEFCSPYQTKIYCSDKCKRSAKKDRRKERDPEGYALLRKKYRHPYRYISRAKKYGCEYEYGITLTSVVNRDGLICKICGKPCDFDDKSYGNGVGPLYPSVDHIIPLSKGGSHTWDNVQIVHCICNSVKRDLLTV